MCFSDVLTNCVQGSLNVISWCGKKIRAKRTLLWLAEMEGFEPPRRFSTPTSRFSRPVPSTAWVHLQMYSRSNVSRKKGEKLGEKSRFSLNFLQPRPVENTGKIEKRLPKYSPVFKTAPLWPLWQRPMVRRTAVCSKKLPQIPRTVNRKTPLYNDFRQKGVA